MESGVTALTREDAEGYLGALASEDADQYVQYLTESWTEIEKPPFDLPGRSDLRMAEESLRTLRALLDDPQVPALIKVRAEFYRKELKRHSVYLESRLHRVAYVGDVGVGKTTLLCTQSGLVLSEGEHRTGGRRIVLETGGGGTTVCEVHLHRGPMFAIRVEPEDDSAIYRLVGEFCAGVWHRVHDSAATSEGGSQEKKEVSREIERALRNLADLQSSRKKGPDGKPLRVDPARDLADKFENLDAFQAAVCERLQLSRRTLREEIFQLDGREAGMAWLKETFERINNGRHPDFGLPRRVDITVPFAPLDMDGLDVEIVDTRGVDGTAIRPDLQACVDDERALTVLCSRFNSAPDVSMQGFIKHLIGAGSERTLEQRSLFIVLARATEATEMKDDSGQLADSAAEGYELKREQVESKLIGIGFHNPVIEFADVMQSGEAMVAAKTIEDGIRELRNIRASAIAKIGSSVKKMKDDLAHENAMIAQETVNDKLRRFATRHRGISEEHQLIHQLLLIAIEYTHPASIWATTRRAGTWYNFDVYHYLGSGAVNNTRLRVRDAIQELRGLIHDMRDDTKMESVHGFLDQLSEHIDHLESRFLKAVRRGGEHVFRPALENDKKLWAACEEPYGRGIGYRSQVAKLLREWFESGKREHLHETYDLRVQKAWSVEVLAPLNTLCQNQPNPLADS